MDHYIQQKIVFIVHIIIVYQFLAESSSFFFSIGTQKGLREITV